MGQFLNFGQVVQDLNIQRADVAVGYTGYCVLLDQRVLAKQVVFMDRFGFVEVSAEDLKDLHKMPMTYYLMLAARLTTDPYGKVYGDDITVEYMRMSRTQYMDFQRSVTANPSASAVMLTKEKRTDKNGKDVSGVKFMAAQLELSPAIQQKLQLLKADPAVIDSLFAQVDSIMGAPVASYKEWLVTQRQEGVAPVGQGQNGPAIPQQTYGGGAPQRLGAGQGYGAPVGGGYPQGSPYGGSTAPHAGAMPQVGSPVPPSYTGGAPAYGGASAPIGGGASAAPAPAPAMAAPQEEGWGVSGFDNEFDGQGGF